MSGGKSRLTQSGTSSQIVQLGEVIRIDPELRTANGLVLPSEVVACAAGFEWIQSNPDGTFDAQNVSQ